MSADTPAQRHLEMLDEIAGAGMVLLRRLTELPPLPRQDTARDFDVISRAVRRSILLYHLLEQGRLPHPKSAPGRTNDPTAERPDTIDADRIDRPRMDPVDTIDDVAGPFVQVVTGIVRDIQAALAAGHYPADQAELVGEIARRPLPHSLRPEADVADLE